MPENQFEKVYISYSWKTEDTTPLVEKLQAWCVKQSTTFHVVRERDELKYKEHIDQFMQKIAENWYVVGVISDNYMRSVYCMTELLGTYETGDFDRRFLPIKAGAYWPVVNEQVKLVKYWKEEVEKVESLNTNEAIWIRKIAKNLDDLLKALGPINTEFHSDDENVNFKKIAEIIHHYQEEEQIRYQRQEKYQLFTG